MFNNKSKKHIRILNWLIGIMNGTMTKKDFIFEREHEKVVRKRCIATHYEIQGTTNLLVQCIMLSFLVDLKIYHCGVFFLFVNQVS